MYEKYFAFSCCGLFLFITLSLQNYIINEEDYNLTARYEINMDSTTIYNNNIKSLQYDLYEKFTNHKRYGMQNEFRTKNENVDKILNKLNRRSVQNPEDDAKILINSHINSTNVNRKENLMSQEIYEYLIERNNSTSYEVIENSSENSNETKIVPYEMCHNITCILLCCPLGNRMSVSDYKCISEDIKYVSPNVSGNMNDSIKSENKEVDQLYQFAVYDSCRDKIRLLVDKDHQYDYTIFANGSIYLSDYKFLFKSTSYCLGVFSERGNKYEVTFCLETSEQVVRHLKKGRETYWINVCVRMLRLLFLVSIFLVYSILPELRNVHGFMLCNYSVVSSFLPIILFVRGIYYKEEMPHSACITMVFLHYFFDMSSCFWRTAMSFNMWQTFRAFSSLRRDVRRSEKKTLIYYTIFAYGCPFLLSIVCVVILDFISNYIPTAIKPGFIIGNCWYYGMKSFLLYFYWIKSFNIIISVCLSISAALNIRRYEKIADFHQTDSESKRYNDNKKWFSLYMHLFIMMFIVMGLNWVLVTTLWIFGKLRYYIIFSGFLDVFRDFCTFIIFVWKKKIKLMLLKRFGFETKQTSNI